MELVALQQFGMAQRDHQHLEGDDAILDREALQGGFERSIGAIKPCGQHPSGSRDKLASAPTQKVRVDQGDHTTTGGRWTPFLSCGATLDREAVQGGRRQTTFLTRKLRGASKEAHWQQEDIGKSAWQFKMQKGFGASPKGHGRTL